MNEFSILNLDNTGENKEIIDINQNTTDNRSISSNLNKSASFFDFLCPIVCLL
jgi:hypothetical protein